MGHAITAYLGHITDPKVEYMWEALSKKNVINTIRKAMKESAKSLIVKYPKEFNQTNMNEYISDLITRFNNKYLGDTLYRVGRDLPRKLSRNDRLIGAILFDMNQGMKFTYTAFGTAAAFFFRCRNEAGQIYLKVYLFLGQSLVRFWMLLKVKV